MNPTSLKIVTHTELKALVRKWRGEGLVLVFTNGCFDLLHFGHIDYLEKARGLGDKLIIGLNTDSSVKALKGSNRPLNNENIRGRILAALDFVDAVVLFAENTPQALIADILPDVLVKGGDYHAGNIAGAEIVLRNGGRVEIIDMVEGYSTTGIIEQIKGLN